MGKVPINLDSLKELLRHAKAVGTVDSWCECAIEYAQGCNDEIERLRAELAALTYNGDVSDRVKLIVRLPEKLYRRLIARAMRGHKGTTSIVCLALEEHLSSKKKDTA